MPMIGTTFAALNEMPHNNGGGQTAGINPGGGGGLELRLMRLKLMAEREAQNQKLAAEQQMQQAALSHAAMMQSGQLGFSQSALNQKLAAEQAVNQMHHGEFQTTEGRLGQSENAAQEFRLKNLMQRAAEMKAQQDLQTRRLDMEAPGMQAHNALTDANTAAVLGQYSRAQQSYDNDPNRINNEAMSPILRRLLAMQGLADGGQSAAPASVTNPFGSGEEAEPGYNSAFPGEGEMSPLGGASRSPLGQMGPPHMPGPWNVRSPESLSPPSQPQNEPQYDDMRIGPPISPDEMRIGPPLGSAASGTPLGGAPQSPLAPSSGIMQSPDPNATEAGAGSGLPVLNDSMAAMVGIQGPSALAHQRAMEKFDEQMKQLQIDKAKRDYAGEASPQDLIKTNSDAMADFINRSNALIASGMSPEQAQTTAQSQTNAVNGMRPGFKGVGVGANGVATLPPVVTPMGMPFFKQKFGDNVAGALDQEADAFAQKKYNDTGWVGTLGKWAGFTPMYRGMDEYHVQKRRSELTGAPASAEIFGTTADTQKGFHEWLRNKYGMNDDQVQKAIQMAWPGGQ